MFHKHIWSHLSTLWGESIHCFNASTLKLLRSCFTECIQGQLLSIFSNPLKPSCHPIMHIILLLLFLIKAQKSAENTAPISSVSLKYSAPIFNRCYKSTHWSPRHLIHRRKPKLCLQSFIFKSLVYIAIYRLFHFTALKSMLLNCKIYYKKNCYKFQWNSSLHILILLHISTFLRSILWQKVVSSIFFIHS